MLQKKQILVRVGLALLKIVMVVAISFFAGEVFLRVVFWNGASFGSHGGPIVKEFERNFQFNSFDRSRGPEAHEAKQSGTVRLLVQGDSVTWGQGVTNESDLYTSRLLAMLQAEKPGVEMAVLAYPGREIDAHLEQLSKYGPELQPDVIIYQWYTNDLELHTKAHRPRKQRLWQLPYVHRFMSRYSYLWFYLDFRLDSLVPAPKKTYEDYLLDYFGHDTPAWREFESVFTDWAHLAKSLAGRTVVVLYPSDMDTAAPYRLGKLHDRVAKLAEERGVVAIDLADFLRPHKGDPKAIAAPMDAHPSAFVHNLIAQHLHRNLVQLYPELLRPSTEKGAVARHPF